MNNLDVALDWIYAHVQKPMSLRHKLESITAPNANYIAYTGLYFSFEGGPWLYAGAADWLAAKPELADTFLWTLGKEGIPIKWEFYLHPEVPPAQVNPVGQKRPDGYYDVVYPGGEKYSVGGTFSDKRGLFQLTAKSIFGPFGRIYRWQLVGEVE